MTVNFELSEAATENLREFRVVGKIRKLKVPGMC